MHRLGGHTGVEWTHKFGVCMGWAGWVDAYRWICLINQLGPEPTSGNESQSYTASLRPLYHKLTKLSRQPYLRLPKLVLMCETKNITRNQYWILNQWRIRKQSQNQIFRSGSFETESETNTKLWRKNQITNFCLISTWRTAQKLIMWLSKKIFYF